MTSRTLAKRVITLALEKKARNIVLLDLRKLSAAADFFVVCSADSDTQVKAIADAVRNGTDRIGSRPWHSEGWQALSWVLLDYVDVVLHVFHRQARSFYNLERLWADAKRYTVEESEGVLEFVEHDKPPARKPPKSRSTAKPRRPTAQRKAR
ncbi:MAG: ribosome silencing factor [Bacteroidota bacterium]